MSLILHSHEFSWEYSFPSGPSKSLISYKRNMKFRALGISDVGDSPVQSSTESLLGDVSLDILFCSFQI